jgi:hypothetical protein
VVVGDEVVVDGVEDVTFFGCGEKKGVAVVDEETGQDRFANVAAFVPQPAGDVFSAGGATT